MRIEKIIGNKEKIEEYYNNYLTKKLIIKSNNPQILKKAHIEKAKHNLNFSQEILNLNEYSDWIIVSLYYTLYHSFLSLLEHKGYSSKNHNATLVFVLKHYVEFEEEELELFNNLKISEEDAIFYTSLKEKRNEASYSTKTKFNDDDIESLLNDVKKLLVKITNIINDD